MWTPRLYLYTEWWAPTPPPHVKIHVKCVHHYVCIAYATSDVGQLPVLGVPTSKIFLYFSGCQI
jgi:hypothetical protein